MVVGMDWLQAYGPMWVDWTMKQLQFQHKGEIILLQGVQNQLSAVQMISSAQLCLLEESNAISHMVCLCTVESVVEHILVPI